MENYKDTLNLPKTKFPMKGNLVLNEINILDFWYKNKIYYLIRKIKKNKKKFILHDGPPYANGNIHIGHAVNKILKDIIIKYKTFSGYNAPYIPGWDCHGLPIELKVENIYKEKNINLNLFEFHKKCRIYVKKQIKQQKKDFIKLGVLADWKNPFLTMDFNTEANTIRVLKKIIKNGYLYKGCKPVYWCFNCRSTLAEAEIEYIENKIDAVYISFKSKNYKNILKIFNLSENKSLKKIYILIWTTTPWTLPANKALAINPKFEYQLLKIEEKNFIIAKKLVKILLNKIQVNSFLILGTILGKKLKNIIFKHPFINLDVPLIFSDHVNLETGTGIVHIAPGHGYEDYILGKKYNLEILNITDERGFYIDSIDISLKKLHVINSIKKIINFFKKKNCLLYKEIIFNKSPICWRHKSLIIFRSTDQWFINIDKNNLRKKIIKKIEKVNFLPNYNKSYLKSMLQNRNDWCISRQRNWGVPISIFTNKYTGELHPNTLDLMEKIAKLVEKKGIQEWWNLKIEHFLGNDHINYVKVLDTLDVWFDSGSTYLTIINKTQRFNSYKPTDLYLEGSDQHRGWFMSSLIISMAAKNIMPFKQILTHGFTVDTNKLKMSKSIGNIITPQEISDKLGSDILRLWVASSDFTKEISISNEILERATDKYRRIRNTIRFILANLNNFNPKTDLLNIDNLILLDKWIINKTLSTQKKIIDSYKKYNFNNVIKIIIKFCSIYLGSLYLDIIKDRQYTNKSKSKARLSCQTALYCVIESISRWIAPILSFTAEEIWKFIPGKRSLSIFLEEWYNKYYYINLNKDKINKKYWNFIFKIRNEVNKALEISRDNKIIKNSLEAEIIIYCDNKILNKLNLISKELQFLFITSSVIIKEYNLAQNKVFTSNKFSKLKIFIKKSKNKKCKRCWHYVINLINNENNNLCYRCINNLYGNGENRKYI